VLAAAAAMETALAAAARTSKSPVLLSAGLEKALLAVSIPTLVGMALAGLTSGKTSGKVSSFGCGYKGWKWRGCWASGCCGCIAVAAARSWGVSEVTTSAAALAARCRGGGEAASQPVPLPACTSQWHPMTTGTLLHVVKRGRHGLEMPMQTAQRS
jgi:hypothetical protein